MTIPDLRAKLRSRLGLDTDASDRHILAEVKGLTTQVAALRNLLTRSRIAYDKTWGAVVKGDYICERGDSLVLWAVLGRVGETEDDITLAVLSPAGNRHEFTKRRSDEVQVFSPSPLAHERELVELLAVELGARLAEACEETC